MIKRLLSAGFPVLLERGHTDDEDGWMGHYSIIMAYDDATQSVQIPDTLLGIMTMGYAELEKDWAHFDGLYLVLYPADRESEVMALLGSEADAHTNLLNTLAKLDIRIGQVGQTSSSLYSKVRFGGTGAVSTRLRLLTRLSPYITLTQVNAPAYLYQVGPYLACYYTGRYQDVFNQLSK